MVLTLSPVGSQRLKYASREYYKLTLDFRSNQLDRSSFHRLAIVCQESAYKHISQLWTPTN